ncbi:iron-containing alcohol dehydrogenase family protein [Thermosipho atlanticus]|uniref:Alcohol dehydrogenase, class IV n=1 Tax=Thermosipho atlanticus DSM 15807 TaxID=1123380 RepID=A0A1M5SKA6_9BACT|nr:iron-containing alcohol dehydrogenase family protein [Thermosipho atlanticus]SHH38688.1 Alcohol dehydrogenase, class IV [Thermosipho atlanticus DSM 15807]
MAFYLPTKIMYENEILKNEIDKLGKRFLIITGKSSKRNGSLEDLINLLESLDKEYEIFDESKENPPKELIENITQKYGKNWDVVVGLGGGSPMDTAKAVAVLCKNNISVEDLYDQSKYDTAANILCIPTTAGTGSEVTQYSVLTINGRKRGFKHEKIFPKIAILNPKYTISLPKDLTISTGLDAFSHAVESALSLRSNEFSEIFAFKAIKIIKNTLPKLVNDLENYEYRKEMLLASTYAGIAISITGTTIAHSLGYSLTTDKNLRHGIATAVFLPFEMKIAGTKKSKIIHELVGDIEDFIKTLGVEIYFETNESEIEKWVNAVSNSSHVKVTPGNFNKEKIKEAYYWLIEKSKFFRR